MTKKWSFIALAILFGTGAFGCASNPNKEAKEARAQEVETRRQNNEAVADEQGDRERSMAKDQRQQTADATKQQYGTQSATYNRVVAESKMTERRNLYQADVRERLQKHDARFGAMQSTVSQRGAAVPTRVRDSLSPVETERAAVGQDLNALPRIPDDGWENAKKNLDKRLDQLESLLSKAKEQVDSVKNP